MAAYKAHDTIRKNKQTKEPMDLELSPTERAIKECVNEIRNQS